MSFLNDIIIHKIGDIMEEYAKGDKIVRVLQMYAKLADGYVVNKEEGQYYGVNECSIQRDINDIRNF